MAETPESLLKLINASGFLFQLRVAHEIEQSAGQHGYRIAAREHRWINPVSGDDGFIYLVLENGRLRLVVECKRVLDGTWVFLVPNTDRADTTRARAGWTHEGVDRSQLGGWHDFWVEPKSQEALFCQLRGQNERDKPMLERVAGTLLHAVEAIASEELGYGRSDNTSRERIKFYVPVIVTNARLEMCRFSPSEVDINSGQLPDGHVTFQTVPFIRFRKPLTTTLNPRMPPQDLMQANMAQERTVFVVNVAALPEFLRACTIRPWSNSEWPWPADLTSRGPFF